MSVQLALELDGTAARAGRGLRQGQHPRREGDRRALRRPRRGAGAPEVKAIFLERWGSHFSFGASVAEHLPDGVRGMIPEAARPGAAAGGLRGAGDRRGARPVPGRRPRGGAELLPRIVAAPDAKLGQPEIVARRLRPGGLARSCRARVGERAGHGPAASPASRGCRRRRWRHGLVDESPRPARPRPWPTRRIARRVPASAPCARRTGGAAPALSTRLDVELAQARGALPRMRSRRTDGGRGAHAPSSTKRAPDWSNVSSG